MSNKITSARALRCRHWYQKSVAELDDSLREVLEVLDRLVEAARALMDDADEHDLLRDYVTVDRVLYEELATALRDIELESE